MTLALFDLDNTLLAGDSDHAWGEFLISEGLVDADQHRQINDGFYEDYKNGHLDIAAYVDFALGPVKQIKEEQRVSLHKRFMEKMIEPMLLTKAFELIDKHRQKNHTLVIITATNRFITEPIAQRLGVDILLATEPEKEGEMFTGRLKGTPCFQEGKVVRMQEWLSKHGGDLEDSFFYSDSFNDLPLLEKVSFPHAVDPDAKLYKIATERQWPVLSLR